jgi:CubicO group peptidase (beta-lactamase class C family)
MTKPISALAALLLVDRGIINLNDTVEKYIPEFSKIKIVTPDAKGNFTIVNSLSNKVKIVNLLNHTSGIGCNAEKIT